jgi:hypothetical protein
MRRGFRHRGPRVHQAKNARVRRQKPSNRRSLPVLIFWNARAPITCFTPSLSACVKAKIRARSSERLDPWARSAVGALDDPLGHVCPIDATCANVAAFARWVKPSYRPAAVGTPLACSDFPVRRRWRPRAIVPLPITLWTSLLVSHASAVPAMVLADRLRAERRSAVVQDRAAAAVTLPCGKASRGDRIYYVDCRIMQP